MHIADLDPSIPKIMGIVNVTPDSFSDGGRFSNVQEAIDHALRLEDEGANILDIGGESTRPGAEPVPLEEELRRVLPVIEGLQGRIYAKISIDTRKAEVMRQAADAGALILNDVSALTHDPESIKVAVHYSLPVVLMHAQGDPRTMQENPVYTDVVQEVYDFLKERIAICETTGILKENIIIDPGIGFGKTLEHNLALLAHLDRFHSLGVSVLLGASRKRFIADLTGEKDADRRMPGSIAAALHAASKGVQIIRVHDVWQTRQALQVGAHLMVNPA